MTDAPSADASSADASPTSDVSDVAATAPTWGRADELARFSPVAGIGMRSLVGGALMANWVTIDPGAEVPDHAHPHEQLGVMLEGRMAMTIAGETRDIGPGDCYVVPPHVRHGARSEAGCVVLDIFTPVREDYAALSRAAGQA